MSFIDIQGGRMRVVTAGCMRGVWVSLERGNGYRKVSHGCDGIGEKNEWRYVEYEGYEG